MEFNGILNEIINASTMPDIAKTEALKLQEDLKEEDDIESGTDNDN